MSTRALKVFPVFELTIVLALALIGWAAFRLYEIVPAVDDSSKKLSESRAEYYQISDNVQLAITELNDSLTNYLTGKDPKELERFRHKSQEFRQWLDAKRLHWEEAHLESVAPETSPALTNPSVWARSQMLPLLSQIDQATTNYLKAAAFLLRNDGPVAGKERTALREQTSQRARFRLLNLARQARMRGEMLELAIGTSQKRFGALEDRFQHLRWTLLLAVTGLCFLLMLAIYRSRVAQTQALIERERTQHREQEAMMDKLAHFGRLAQELAHEIKQPLTAINARAYTLQKTLIPGSDEHKDAAVIRNEIKRLDRTVKDFLELARPAEPNPIPVTAEELLGEVRDLMASQLQQESIEFKFDCDREMNLLADAQQLKQVLINLVKNAAESVDHNGIVTLRCRKGMRDLQGELTEAAIIEVEDNGPGIPPEIQSKIFDPFFSTKGDGTGLGLAIAARIIDKHGGNIEFDSQPGKGTIFRIVLPACRDGQLA